MEGSPNDSIKLEPGRLTYIYASSFRQLKSCVTLRLPLTMDRVSHREYESQQTRGSTIRDISIYRSKWIWSNLSFLVGRSSIKYHLNDDIVHLCPSRWIVHIKTNTPFFKRYCLRHVYLKQNITPSSSFTNVFDPVTALVVGYETLTLHLYIYRSIIFRSYETNGQNRIHRCSFFRW